MGKTLDKLLNVGKKLIVGTAIAMSTFFPNKLNAQTPLWYDVFSPKNEVVNYFSSYGNGDVNQDGDVDSDDLTAMDTIQNFYSDVNGDGQQSTVQDKQVLTEYLNGTRAYMPADWWKSTPEERKAWIEGIYPVMTELNDQEYVYSDDINKKFNSTNFGIQDFLTGNGYGPNRDDFDLIHEKYNLDHNGLFNIPIYHARVHSDDGLFNHGISAIFTGNNLNDVDDWLFLESQRGIIVEPGINDGSIPYKSRIDIYGVHDFQSSNIIDEPLIMPAVDIHIDAVGNREMTYLNPNMIVDKTTLDIEDGNNSKLENFTLKQNYPNPFNSSTSIPYSFDKELNMSLDLYNIKGEHIRNLEKGIKQPGEYVEKFNTGSLPSGNYIINLRTSDGYPQSRKISLVK